MVRIQRSLSRGEPYEALVAVDGHRAVEMARDFQVQLQKAQVKMNEAELNSLFEQVNQLGEILTAKQSLEAAKSYKQAVIQLISVLVKDGVKVKTTTLADTHGKRKVYAILDAIDEGLNELMDTLVQRQKQPLDILRLVGEVKGLLISLRT